jgi:hypothetical protein
MPTYLIQKRIHSLMEDSIYDEADPLPFTSNNIQFSSWVPEAWTTRFWLAESTRDAHDFISAWKAFQETLSKTVSRVAFVGQAYHTDLGQPYLIKRADSNIAYFRHSQDRQPVPLHFGQEELDSLRMLLADTRIPDAFYFYWNDVVNAVGYAAKLVLIFAAIEILFEKASRTNHEFYSAIEAVFGPALKRELYGTPGNSRSGLRQRLVHGDYLSEVDTKNYVDAIHHTIVRYFNQGLLRSHPLNEGVVSPQRHLFGNLEGWKGFIRPETDAQLLLKRVHEAFEADDSNPAGYAIVPPNERPEGY